MGDNKKSGEYWCYREENNLRLTKRTLGEAAFEMSCIFEWTSTLFLDTAKLWD